MREPSSTQIRSYHRAFHFELMLYTLGNLRPWRPVPARGVLYTAVCEMVMIALAHAFVIDGVISGFGPVVLYGVIPLAVGWLLTVARVEGRRFHVAARVCARHFRCGRTLTGGYRAIKRSGSKWQPRRVLVINDGRDGAPPNGLRLEGPGRVLLRYPCSARLDGARLTIVHTSQRPCDPGQVLTIAEGASARFIAGANKGARGVVSEASPHLGATAVGGSERPLDAGRKGRREAEAAVEAEARAGEGKDR
jgi:hypothetical protein